MDLETLRTHITEGIAKGSADALAVEIVGVTGQSLINFSTGAVKRPREPFLSRMESWAIRKAGQSDRSTSAYELGLIEGQARTVHQFLRTALEHQEQIIRGLAQMQPYNTRAMLDASDSLEPKPTAQEGDPPADEQQGKAL